MYSWGSWRREEWIRLLKIRKYHCSQGAAKSHIPSASTTTFYIWSIVKIFLHTRNLHQIRIHGLKRNHRTNYLHVILNTVSHSRIGPIIKRITIRKERQKKQKQAQQHGIVHSTGPCSDFDHDLYPTDLLVLIFPLTTSTLVPLYSRGPHYRVVRSFGLKTNMEPFRFLLAVCPLIGDDEPHVPIPAGSEYLPHARVPIELENR